MLTRLPHGRLFHRGMDVIEMNTPDHPQRAGTIAAPAAVNVVAVRSVAQHS